MNNCILVRYGEIYLKGKNKVYFENTLIKNIKKQLSNFVFDISKISGRFLISNYDISNEQAMINALQTVFGVYSISNAVEIDSDYDEICKFVNTITISTHTFKVDVNRGDKTFPKKSNELAPLLGEIILNNQPDLKVNLKSPETTVFVDIRENQKTYIFYNVIKCLGGMPVGTSGKGLLMLSGGIDSPVAGYLMAKRGMTLDAVYFHSFPYTGDLAKEKVVTLANIISRYSIKLNLYIVKFTEIQEEIHKHCDPEYMITIMRRFMMRIARKLATKYRAQAIITGESLAQVASQTVESMTVTGDVVKDMPVFRPLIGQDKEDIIKISRSMGAFETSILPYQDCCTVFLPKHPVIKPKIKKAEIEESKLNVDELVDKALLNVEIVRI